MYNTIQKTIAAWAFNHYIAYYYFDNVNVNQLKVAFEKGEVELENLPIKKDALQHFNLPMEVVSGVVGKLSIKVPLLTMLTDSWVIKISDLMLNLTSKKQTNTINNGSSATSNTTLAEDGSFTSLSQGEQSNLAEYLEKVELDEDEVADTNVNSEETKLAEFYSSFSETVSAIVRDIYKNIRLEIESMTILFEDSDHGLERFSVDSLLLHRPKSARNLIMNNLSICLSTLGPSFDDLIKINLERCNLDIHDEASNNMQLVVVTPNQGDSKVEPQSSPATTSEIKIEGNFHNVSIERLFPPDKNSSERMTKIGSDRANDGFLPKRNILKSDTLKIEFKLNNNFDEELNRLTEKNLHIKLDLVGMQYIHSQEIYEMTSHRLMNLLKFFLKLQRKPNSNPLKMSQANHPPDTGKNSIEKSDDMSLNKLLIINIEEGLLYIVDDTSGSCAIPLLEFSLDDCRILQFSGKHQQNGFVFAKIGCNNYNREVSTWDTLLRPWPFNLSWDFKTASMIGNRVRKNQHRQISLNSDEIANFVLSSAFLDLADVALKRIVYDFIHPKLWPLATSLSSNSQLLSQDFNSIFVLRNETGHRLHFTPIEQHSEFFELHEPLRSCSSNDMGGDINQSVFRRISDNSKFIVSNRSSPDLDRWISVDVGETVSFEYETLPIYRRHISDLSAQSRVLLIRVEGWKTLSPISIDRTGLFFREALSDRVRNEDTYVSISIDLEEKSARKIISIRSPLNLVNLLDAALEVHFVESNQTLYIMPNSQIAVPLPYLFDNMHLRPCNVGVTMSEQPLLWDSIKQTSTYASKLHICHPITVTNKKHVSYCGSQPYRVCVSTRRDGLKCEDLASDINSHTSLPVFTVSFIPPLTIVNLLPCEINYSIGDVVGALSIGSQQRIYHVDTTKPIDVHFMMAGFPQSKALNIDPGATGSFHHSLEMFDKHNRSLYLDAEIILSSSGEEPAVQVFISAQFWLINKTGLPLIFKQEGAALEAAGQFCEHEETASSILLFSFYDIEIEPPWLCSMRLGKSKGLSMWCEGFKLEKGSGERRLCFIPEDQLGRDSRVSKSLIDINISRGYGRYSGTKVVTLTARYGFDPLTKTPKKLIAQSPHNYKLTSYNHNANLAEKIAGQAVNLFDKPNRGMSDINLIVPGFTLTLVDNDRENLAEASMKNIAIKCTTTAKEQIIDCSIQDIRIDNLLPDCEKSVMLDRAAASLDESITTKPAVRLIMDRILGNSFGSVLFKQVQLSMSELILNIEEKLALKLVEFMSYKKNRREKHMNNLTHDLDRILHPEEDRLSKYYFDLLRIDLSSLKLSVYTSTNLTTPLQKLKSYLGLKFFGFEDAQVQLAPYFKMNVSRTFKGVFDSVTRFYKQQILEQAPRIVGQQIQNYLRFHLSDLLSTLYDEVYNKLFN